MRYEYKYTIANFRLADLRSMLRPFVVPDPQSLDSNGEYTVRSIYFDTPDFEMYTTKKEHIAHRMKVRLRGYNLGNDESIVFTEIKRKYEGPIVKNRCPVTYGKIKEMFAGGRFEEIFKNNPRKDEARRFFYQIHARRLTPTVNVIYEREPLLSAVPNPENDCRLTIDRNWRCTAFPKVDELFTERNLAFSLDGHFVLEVKFNLFCPAWLKPILAELDLQKAPASKYVTGMEAHPEILPRLFGRQQSGRPFLRPPNLFYPSH
jgi:hypothetical protein